MNLTAPSPVITGWMADWLIGIRGSSPRLHLAYQYWRVRREYGRTEARQFMDFVRKHVDEPSLLIRKA